MDSETLRSNLEKFLGRLSRLGYLAVLSALELAETEPNEVTSRLPGALKRYSDASLDESGWSLNEKAIEIRAEQIRALQAELPTFVVDLLVVDLEAFLHGFLSEAAERDVAKDSLPLETLLAKLWPREARWDAQERKSGRGQAGRAEHWSYSDVILLCEIRNAIVHGNGEVLLARSKQRLLNAGWSEESLSDCRMLKRRGLNDMLRFKRAVRTLANEILTHAEKKSADGTGR